MNDLFLNILPILLLLAFGFVLRQIDFFGETAIQKLFAFVGQILLPCVIFNSILHLDIRTEHLAVSAAYFGFLVLLLGLSALVFRLLHLSRKFFIFYTSCFSFGTMGIPLFTTTFGAENMEYLVALGVGHELYFAIVFITLARIVLRGERFSTNTVLKNLTSPLFCMVLAALLLKFTGLKEVLEATVLGRSVFLTIEKIAGVTTVITMLVVGYRLHFEDKKQIRESFLYALFRLAAAFAVGYAVKALVFDRIVSSKYFDYAYFTLLSQFGSTVLLTMVGEHSSREDMEVACNAFVINALIGIVLYVAFVFAVGAAG